jgi:cellulose synthase/poly-beta-1,6-N-acetylglucosamine synthase-like glycosyltransferase
LDIWLLIIYILLGTQLVAFIPLAAAWMLYEYPHRNKNEKAYRPKVSVVICARNEAENLRNNLDYIFQQQYPNFEVIVVNDCSTDLTAKVLEVFTHRQHNLKVITIEGDVGNKKRALDAGIKATANDVILLTDADCRPASPFWIQAMVNCFDDETDIVLGFSPYTAQKGLLNKIIRFETLYTAFLYGGMALIGMPYMGVGRNLAYRKSIYLNSRARYKYASTLSGDDDLLVNEMANRNNTTICAITEGMVRSHPKTDWSSWWHQKRRHTSAGVHYNLASQIYLGIIYLATIFLYALIVILLLTGTFGTPQFIVYAGGLLLIRLIILLVGLPVPINALEQASLLPFVLICDFLMSVFLFSLGLLSAIKVSTWNNYHHHSVRKKT